MKYIAFAVSLILLAGFAFAADISGKWAGSVAGMDGNDMPITFTFKVDGTALSGIHVINNQETPFKDGKIDGNNISFTVNLDFGGQEMKIPHKGVISGDQIKMSYELMGQPGEFVLKRAN